MRQWLLSMLKEAPSKIVWVILAPVVLAAAAAIIAFLQSIPVYLYIPLSSVTFASMLVMIYVILQLRDRYKQDKSGITEESLEKTLSTWLLNAGYSLTKFEDKHAYFNLSARDVVNEEVRITRLKSDPDRISIYKLLILSREQVQAIANLPLDVYSGIVEDIRINIAAFDIEASGLPDKQQSYNAENNTFNVTTFYLRDRVDFRNQFDVERFYQRIHFVNRATTVVSEYLRRLLRLGQQYPTIQPTPDPPDSTSM